MAVAMRVTVSKSLAAPVMIGRGEMGRSRGEDGEMGRGRESERGGGGGGDYIAIYMYIYHWLCCRLQTPSAPQPFPPWPHPVWP